MDHEIARNACIDEFRRSRRVQEIPLPGHDGIGGREELRLVSSAPGPEVAVEIKDRLTRLCSAFGDLSQSHHEILVLRELEGLSYRQIGQRMDLSRPAVESTLFRARRRLTQEYDELGSGRRCRRVRDVLDSGPTPGLAARERRRVASHLSRCQTCRRHAHALGVDGPPSEPRGLAARLAALLPLPLFTRRASANRCERATAGPGASAIASAGEPLIASMVKAAAMIAIALAGAGMAQGSAEPAGRVHGQIAAAAVVDPAGGDRVARAATADALPAASSRRYVRREPARVGAVEMSALATARFGRATKRLPGSAPPESPVPPAGRTFTESRGASSLDASLVGALPKPSVTPEAVSVAGSEAEGVVSLPVAPPPPLSLPAPDESPVRSDVSQRPDHHAADALPDAEPGRLAEATDARSAADQRRQDGRERRRRQHG